MDLEFRNSNFEIVPDFPHRLEERDSLNSEGAGVKEDLGVWNPVPEALPVPVRPGHRPEHVFRAHQRAFCTVR